ncbi:unnamed protein product [Paramecium octaurelia]|uniref:Uncharacterized protein n=1 Tax=Paramecium octaurelia TaxID=43137 RepID=A0A8S1WP19_PAROT|nr:unnamed protein product [Paramecium octaurelia]
MLIELQLHQWIRDKVCPKIVEQQYLFKALDQQCCDEYCNDHDNVCSIIFRQDNTTSVKNYEIGYKTKDWFNRFQLLFFIFILTMNYIGKTITIAHAKSYQEQNQRNFSLPEQIKLRIALIQLQISNHQIDTHFISFIRLRGGGSCLTKTSSNKIDVYPNFQQIPEGFVTQLSTFTKIISEKSLSFQDKLNQDEVLAAFCWFQNNKLVFHILCIYQSETTKNYQLIEKITGQLMKQLLIYIKLSGFLFHQLLQICNDLLRIIFSYQLKNENGYMQSKIKKEFLETIEEVFSQIQVEAASIWLNGVQFEWQIMKTCVLHLRSNSEDIQLLKKGIFKGICQSIFEQKLSVKLAFSLFDMVKFIVLNIYDKSIQYPIKVYEVYYYFQNLTWSIVFQLKQNNSSIQDIREQIQDGYSRSIKLNKDWKFHYFWVNLISDIMCYRPILDKNEITLLLQSKTVDQNTLNQSLIKLPYSKFDHKLKLLAKHDIGSYESLKLFQKYLIQNQSDIQLLPNYISFNFNAKQEEQFKDEDLFIKSITNQSNLEILKILMKQVKYQNDQIVSNFEKSKNQLPELDSKMKSNDHMQIQLFVHELKFRMNQIKQSSLLLLCLINYIILIVNKERQINEIVLKILQGEQFQIQDQNSKNLKEQIENAIKVIHDGQEKELKDILQNVSQFWIQISQYTSLSHIELIEENLEFERSLQQKLGKTIMSFNNIYNYLNKFHIQISNIKGNFSRLLENSELNRVLNKSLNQINLVEIITSLFKPQLILELIKDSFEYYQKQFQENKEIENLQIENIFIQNIQIENNNQIENLQIKNIQDIRKILIFIHSNINICKGLETILKQHQNIVSSIQAQLQGVFDQITVKQNTCIEQITIFIKKVRDQLQQLIQKYQSQELTEEQLADFNIISNQIKEEINNI